MLHIFAQVLFWARKQGNHQNWVPSILLYKCWLIFMDMSVKNYRVEWMGFNFYDYPGFQPKIKPAQRYATQYNYQREVYSVISIGKLCILLCALCRIWKIMRSCKQHIIIKYPFLSFGKSFFKSPKRFLHVEEFRLSVLCWKFS